MNTETMQYATALPPAFRRLWLITFDNGAQMIQTSIEGPVLWPAGELDGLQCEYEDKEPK